MKRPLPIILVLLVVLGRAATAFAAWDETQLLLLQQYSTPLRWYNVEGAPYWVAGAKPHFRITRQRHLIELEPGEEITLRTATAHTWLRVVAEEKTLSPADLEISFSADARGFIAANPIGSIDPYDPHSLLIALPRDRPSLVRLARPRGSGSKLVFAVWFSIEFPYDTIAPYRATIRLPGKAVSLRRDDQLVPERASLVQPSEGIEIPLLGPTRVQLVARLPWPVDEALREQSLVLQLKLDGANARPLLFSPELDARHRTRVEHSTELVSLRMIGYFNVPYGKHTLRIEPTLPAYLSAFQQLRNGRSDYLVPLLNAPATNAAQALRSALNAAPTDPAMHFAFPAPNLSAHAFADQEQNAWRLARDNNRIDSGAQAADWLNRLSQTRRDYPPARQTLTLLWRQRTFFRELLPSDWPGDEASRPAFFAPTRLSELFEPHRPVAVYNPTLEQASQSLAAGRFLPVPQVESPMRYQLPRRSYDSELRIAAIASGTDRTHFFIQFDGEKPVKVSLDAKLALPVEEREPSLALATMRVLERESQIASNRVAGLPVGEFDLAFTLSEPALMELPLPRHVRQIRIYQETAASPVAVSIAYRAARPFEPGDASFLSLLRQSNPEDVLQMLASVQKPDSPAAPAASRSGFPPPAEGTSASPVELAGEDASASDAPESLRQLHNQFLPLIRLLNGHRLDFSKSVDTGFPPPNGALSPEDSARLKETAASLERAGLPIDAVDIWNRLFWDGSTGDRPEAALAIMRNLDSLGEDYLASQYAHYALLTSRAPEFPQPAIALLENYARETDDLGQLEQLRAFLFTRCPCPRHLSDLVEAFAWNSRDEEVLSAGWLLPRELRPTELMLAAALHLNRWQSFDQLVDALPQPEAKCFWRAQKQLAFYQFAEAEKELQQAGTRGAETLRAVQEGRRIREKLSARDPSERLEALFAWEQWQSRRPGPWDWRDADDVAVHSASTELLFNLEQNQFAHYFRADPDKPVRLCFVGPMRLKIEARPVLGLPFEKAVDDWLEISSFGITNRVPVMQCVPNPGLQLASTTNALPGVKTTAELEWGPGWHEVAVRLAGRPGLIHVQQQQPVLPPRILPTLNSDRMRLVLAGRSVQPDESISRIKEERNTWWVPPELASAGPGDAPVPDDGAHPGPQALQSAILPEAGQTDLQNLRLALRLASTTERPPEFISQQLLSLPVAEQWLAACRWQRWNDFTNWYALPEVERANYLLATQRVRQLLDSDRPHDVRDRINALLQVAEGFPAWRKEAQCRAELLASETNCPAGCRSLLARLAQDLSWAPLAVSPISAGMRPLQVRADRPQDPAARIRRALLPPADTNLFTVSAQNAFAASMTLQHQAEVEVRAELARAGFSPLTPLTISIQIDAQAAQPLPLTTLAPVAGTNFTLTEGSHFVRIWMADPVVNQFVRIAFVGRAEGISNSVWSRPLTEAATENRFLHAATAAQPIRFSWRGPALLRLDETRDGHSITQLRFVPAGEQSVEIPPAAGQGESWYRISVRATNTNQPLSRPVYVLREPETVPPPALPLPDAVPPARALVGDYFRLGGQEDGTWSADVTLRKRRPFDLDTQLNGVVNKFVEVDGAYRKVTPSETLWFSTEGLVRVHQPGDLTLGLIEQVEGRPRASFLDWDWSGEAYVGSTGPGQQDINAAFYTALDIGPRLELNRKLEYRPFAGLFAHYLTLTPDRVATYDYVDQDLFTQYRYQHRWGWVLGNRLEYRPWLDTLLIGYLDASSNENLTPDYWGVRGAWHQLLGPVRTEVAYRFTRFLSDSDRPAPISRQGVWVGLYAEHWINGKNRIEFGGQFRYDWPKSGNSYFFVLSWDFGQGRGYRDQGPQETGFRALRSRRIPSSFNNAFQPGPPGATLP